MRILASPARRNRYRNPFNYLLSEALTAQGCDVVELDKRNGWSGQWDVFHIHWPQHAAGGPLGHALRRSLVLLGRLSVQRCRGARIVWTVHNVWSHDQTNPRLERALMWAITRLVHGLIFLSASSRQAAYEQMPSLKSKPFAVIPHGLYGNRSRKSRDAARREFDLPMDARVVGFLGDIRPYKGLDLLIEAVAQTPPDEVVLFVAGEFQNEAYKASIDARLKELQASQHTIVYRDERLDDAALADAIRACDIVALPYRAIWNSGLALLILENRVGILASDAQVFRELEDELGSEWVRVTPTLSAQVLSNSLRMTSDPESQRLDDFCAARSWTEIGARTLDFYRGLGVRVVQSLCTGDQKA